MELTNENKVMIRTIFKEMRNSLNSFMEAEGFVMSNSQLFTFLSYSPAVLAISSDGVVDEAEIAALEKLSKTIDIKKSVSLEHLELMSVAFEPENLMTNEEFNLRAGAELLFLCRNSATYESSILAALKAMLVFDMNPKAQESLTASFAALMDTMIEYNKSENKTTEKEKIAKIKQELGM